MSLKNVKGTNCGEETKVEKSQKAWVCQQCNTENTISEDIDISKQADTEKKMRYCKFCGEKNEEGIRYCKFCGKNQDSSEKPEWVKKDLSKPILFLGMAVMVLFILSNFFVFCSVFGENLRLIDGDGVIIIGFCIFCMTYLFLGKYWHSMIPFVIASLIFVDKYFSLRNNALILMGTGSFIGVISVIGGIILYIMVFSNRKNNNEKFTLKSVVVLIVVAIAIFVGTVLIDNRTIGKISDVSNATEDASEAVPETDVEEPTEDNNYINEEISSDEMGSTSAYNEDYSVTGFYDMNYGNYYNLGEEGGYDNIETTHMVGDWGDAEPVEIYGSDDLQKCWSNGCYNYAQVYDFTIYNIMPNYEDGLSNYTADIHFVNTDQDFSHIRFNNADGISEGDYMGSATFAIDSTENIDTNYCYMLDVRKVQ